MNVISMWRASIIIRSLSSPRNPGLAHWISFASANRGWSVVIIGVWSIITKNWRAENEQLSWYNVNIMTNRNFTGEGCLLNDKTSYSTIKRLLIYTQLIVIVMTMMMMMIIIIIIMIIIIIKEKNMVECIKGTLNYISPSWLCVFFVTKFDQVTHQS